MGFSISLHSSERRSLIYWRMPGLRERLLGVFVLNKQKVNRGICSLFEVGGFGVGYAAALAVTTNVVDAGMLLALPQKAPCFSV